MKKTIFILAVLTLFWGCVGQADQVSMPTERVIPSRLKLRIVCSKTIVKLGEPVKIMIMMQKLVDDEIKAPTAYWSAIVKVDGKEFKNLNSGGECPWDGPGLVPKGFEIGIGATLSESYGISKETLSVGTHKVSVSIGKDVSNTLTITVIEDNYRIKVNLPELASPESDLSSPFQEVRDAAAKILRESFAPPPRTKWDSLMSKLKPGINKANVLELFCPLSRIGAGTGTTYFESYQLDDAWALTCFYKYNGNSLINNDDLLIKSELSAKIRNVWVNPPPDFTGVWITYYVNGSKSFVMHYNHNDKEDETGFYPTGHINYRGVYKAGAQFGKWIWYNEDGSIKSTKDYSKP